MKRRFMEFVIPLPGRGDLVTAHFLNHGSIHLDGFPVSAELPAGELFEDELWALGFEVALEGLEATNGSCRLFGRPEFALEPSSSSLDKFHLEDGEHIGWRFSFKLVAG